MDQEYHGCFVKKQFSIPQPESVQHSQSQSQAESTECAEKVEAMLSTAVLHLADLWNMLTLEFSEGVAFDPDTALLTPVAEIPPVVLIAMKSKLENSLEWCQLARSRLKDITKSSQRSLPASTTHQEVHSGSLWQMRTMSSGLKVTFAAPS